MKSSNNNKENTKHRPRGGPLEIPGGGVKIPPKKFVQRKMPGK
jgi:hypothetical protein